MVPKFSFIEKKTINGFEICLYNVNLGNPTDFSRLVEFIKNKIKSMKMHDSKQFLPTYLSTANLLPEFAERFQQRVKEINTPEKHKKTWFDVRRSRVTEFMSQLLLEKKYNCIFYDEADKRINLDPIYADRHVPGIDVTGICKDGQDLKFVACEVKASKDGNIPCSVSADLLEDIRKGYSNEKERLSREILTYINNLSKIDTGDQLIKDIIRFLTSLIAESSSHAALLNSVIFFPFLIRNNNEIAKNKNLDDFRDFTVDDLRGIVLKGVIWSFNTDIDSFCNELYDEVLTGVS